MVDFSYFLGVLSAILAGIVVNIGVLLQKKVINKHVNDSNFMISLVKSPLWMLGFLLQVIIGGIIFYMLAIVFIGPALVPGLMASGLIVLALGSTRLLNEDLKKEEIIGIFLMIVGVFTLGISGLSVDVSVFNILDSGFMIRIIVFTAIIISIAIVFEMLQKRKEKFKGVLIAIEAGLILSLNTVWASPGTTVLTHIVDGVIIEEEVFFAIVVVIILIMILVIGTIKGQVSLKYGQVNILAPLTGVPIQVMPLIAYFIVFLSVPSSVFSALSMVFGLSLIIISTFLLSKIQANLERINS